MSEADDETTGAPAAEILARFLESHPGGSEKQFESWAASQPELKSDAKLRSGASKLLQDWLRAEKLLQLGMEFDDGGSIFRRRQGAPRESSAQAPGSEALREGRRIGSFTLTRFIAKGGMGQVWEAEDTELRRKVALKLVLPDRIDERSLELFAREARAGGRLNHPNLVTTLAYGTDDGLSWIAQELVEGSWTIKDSLDALRADEAVPKGYYREVAELVAKIADGMQAVHDAGVIHRDLKPQNILIAEDDTPKVTDFGLARVTDDSVMSQSGDFAGTWAYMSPEQVTAKRMGLDHRTDIFSLGVVMYELLTLRKPFEGDTTHQIAQEIIYADPPEATKVRSQCPMELSVIAGKAMEKVPGNRYGSMGELAADLRRHLASEPILARAPGAIARGTKWVRRHPAISSAGAIAAVALAVVTALSLGLASQKGELAATANQLRTQTDNANDAKAVALARAAEARWQQHVANLSLAAEALGRGDTRLVHSALERAPLEHRGWVWNYLYEKAHQELVTMPEEVTGSFQVAFTASADGRLTATADWSRCIQIWNVAAGEETHRLRTEADVLCLDLACPGGLLLSGHEGGAACLWEVESGALVRRIDTDSESAVVQCAIALASGRILLAREDGTVELHFLQRAGLAASTAFDVSVDVLELSPGEDAVALVLGDSCKVLSLPEGKTRFQADVRGGSGFSMSVRNGERSVRLLGYVGLRPRFSPDGSRLAIPQDAGVEVVDASDGRSVFHTPDGLDGAPVALGFRGDEALLICSDSGRRRCWELSTGELEMDDQLDLEWVDLAAVSGDGNVAWVDESFNLGVATSSRAPRLLGHTEQPTGLRFSSDGAILFSHDRSCTRAWRVPSLTSRSNTALAPDGSVRVTDGRILDPATGVACGALMGRVAFQDLETASEGDGRGWKIGTDADQGEFSPDARHFLAVVDGGIGWWTSWGRLRGTLGRGNDGGYVDAESFTISDDSRHVAALVDLNRDSMVLPGSAGDFGVPAGTSSGSVYVWSLANGEQVLDLAGGIHDCAFVGNGAELAVARRRGGVSVIELSTGLTRLELPSDEPVLHVEPAGIDMLVVAYESGRLEVVRVEDGAVLGKAEGAGGPDVLTVGSDNGCVFSATHSIGELWSLPDLDRVGQQLVEKQPITGAAFHPHGGRLAVATAGGTIRLLGVERGDPLVSMRTGQDLMELSFEPDGDALVARAKGTGLLVWQARRLGLPPVGIPAPMDGIDGLFASSPDIDTIERAVHGLIVQRPERRAEIEAAFRQRAAAVVERARRLLAETYDPLQDDDRWRERLRALSQDQLSFAEAARTMGLLRTHPFGVNEAAWEVVAKPGAPADRVALAVAAMERVLSSGPGNPNFLNTLGVARYRAGRFKAAVEALRLADRRAKPDPLDAGFLALALNALGENAAAEHERQRFRRALEDPRWLEHQDVRQAAKEIESAFDGSGR